MKYLLDANVLVHVANEVPGVERIQAKLLGLRLGQAVLSAVTAHELRFMIAAREGYLELVSFLIARKASVTRRSPHGDTALMLASLKGHLATAKRLVESGAEITHGGWTPLHYAAFEGRTEVVKYLIEKGADKNDLAPNGYTPLMLAARGGHLAATETLLHEDADLYVKGPKGETALSRARAGNHKDLESLLTRAGAIN